MTYEIPYQVLTLEEADYFLKHGCREGYYDAGKQKIIIVRE